MCEEMQQALAHRNTRNTYCFQLFWVLAGVRRCSRSSQIACVMGPAVQVSEDAAEAHTDKHTHRFRLLLVLLFRCQVMQQEPIQ